MSVCKYREVAAVLGKEIQESKYSAGKFPSVVALMRRFRVSRATASRVVGEFKRRGVVKGVSGRGIFISRAGASRKIAILFPETGTSEYYTKIVKTITILAQKKEYVVLFAEIESTDSKMQVSEAERMAKIICENDVSGVIFQPVAHVAAMEAVNKRILSVFGSAKIPVVLCDCDCLLDVSERSEFDVVGVNNIVAGAMLYRHLYEAGAGRISYLTIADSARSHNDRLRGAALEHRKLVGKPWQDSSVLIANPDDLSAVKRYVRKERPDGFICGNDRTAALLLRTLGQIGVSVPADMLVTGFNDVSISRLSSPSITTVRQPTDVIGQTVLRRLFERIAKPDLPTVEILVNAPLVARESTNCKTTERQPHDKQRSR